jgi:hypothetical protein
MIDGGGAADEDPDSDVDTNAPPPALGLGDKIKDVHASALRTILEMQPLPDSRPKAKPSIAMDAAGAKGFAERFRAARISEGGCSALLQDEITILTQTLGLIGVSVGAGMLSGIFPPAAPIALPLLGG